MIAGSARDAEFSTFDYAGYIMDWNVAGNTINYIELTEFYVINHFTTMAVGANWGVLYSAHFGLDIYGNSWEDGGYPQLQYGTVSGGARAGLLTQGWVKQIGNAQTQYCVGVETIGSTFMALYIIYSGPNIGKVLMVSTDSSGSSFTWKVLTLGVVADGDEIGIWTVTASSAHLHFAGYTEGYQDNGVDVVLPGRVGFLTRIATDMVSGSADTWATHVTPTGFSNGITWQNDEADRASDHAVYTSGFNVPFGLFNVEFTALPVGGVSIADAPATYLETGVGSLASYTYVLAAADRTEAYTVTDPALSFLLAETLTEDGVTCSGYSADLTWSVTTNDAVHMALTAVSSPVAFDSTTGQVDIYSTSDADAGTFNFGITVSYSTLLGGALASHTLTLQVVISQAPVVPPTPIVLTTSQIAELEVNLEDFETMNTDN